MGDFRSLVLAVVQWYVSVRLAMPDINTHTNIFQAEPPRREDCDVIQGRPLPTLTIALAEI